jgi:Ca-activated chloride channel homolog
MPFLLRHRRLVVAGAIAAALVLVAVAALRLAPGGSSGSSGASSSNAPAGSTGGERLPAAGGAAKSASGSYSDGVALATPATSAPIASDIAPLDLHRFLVRTGEMTLVVATGDVPQAAARIVALTSGYGGYVLTSQVSGAEGASAPFADITIRVPAGLYDVAIRRFGALGRVQGVQTSATDVTSQYVDLSARLAQARRVDQRLLGFLARATTVNEALAVQSRIDSTELKVEELTGQIKALHEQVSYGTLTVSISERVTHHTTTHRHGFLGALSTSWRHLVSGFEAIVVGIGAVLPFAVLLAALALAAWFAARAARARGTRPSVR